MKIIILAGGSGTRLWPLSRDKYPKQFIKLFNNNHSLFQETFLRSLLLVKVDDIIIVTNKNYKHLVIGEIEELGYPVTENNILVEPNPKNTLPAILAGIQSVSYNQDELFLVFPSDHKIQNPRLFTEIINQSLDLAKDRIITFGIQPDSAQTGYGYIQPGDTNKNGCDVLSFREKPNYETAVQYIENGYLWNAGIFMFQSMLFLNEVEKFQATINNAFRTTNNIDDAFSLIDKGISIDYGILEHSQIIATVPLDIGWNDLGSFDSFYDVDLSSKSSNETIEINSNNNLIYPYKDKVIATIGVNNLIVVDTKDALLVCQKEQSQDVKKVIDKLKLKKDQRLEYHVQDYRPWGNYTILEEQKNEFKIKRILVQPHKKISYQYHNHRSEHWIVVRGIATITIDDIDKEVKAGESIFIKPLQKHRLANNTFDNVEIIEVQLGDYLEEDDIYRIDDDYGRI